MESITLSAAGRTVIFAGIPNANYEILWAPAATGPWSVLSGVITAASNGPNPIHGFHHPDSAHAHLQDTIYFRTLSTNRQISMTIKSITITAAALAAMLSTGAWAQVTVTQSQTDNDIIPDYVSGNLNPITENMVLNNTGIQSISSVQVTLDLAAGGGGIPWNGDYYAYLTDPTGSISILLNRVGVTDATNPNDFGYSDLGFDITLTDSGTDIHNYQNGTYNLNSDGQITGDWAPDEPHHEPVHRASE